MLKGFGDRLREAREAAGLLQSQLAELSGMAQSEISRLERSQRKRPGWHKINALERLLNLAPGTLLGGGELRTGKSFERFMASKLGAAAELTPDETDEYKTTHWWGLGDREPGPKEWYQYVLLRRALREQKK